MFKSRLFSSALVLAVCFIVLAAMVSAIVFPPKGAGAHGDFLVWSFALMMASLVAFVFVVISSLVLAASKVFKTLSKYRANSKRIASSVPR